MKIMSLNLHCLKEDNREIKWDKIIDFILNNDIDVCLFQEAAQEKDENIIFDNIKHTNNAHYIANKLNYNIVFHPVKIGFETLEEGLAIISKHKISDVSYATISKTNDFRTWHKRDYLKANIAGYTFYNVHLGWDINGETGIDQINGLLEAAKNDNNCVFLCGDFNYPDDSNEIKHIKLSYHSVSDLANINSLDNPTFHYSLDNNAHFQNRMIDFIFTNNKIKIKEFKIIFNSEKDYVSDHNALYLEF